MLKLFLDTKRESRQCCCLDFFVLYVQVKNMPEMIIFQPFDCIESAGRERVQNLFKIQIFQDKTRVLKKNLKINQVGYILSGKIDLFSGAAYCTGGKKGSLKSGDYFGLTAVIDQEVSAFDARCSGEVVCCTITVENFLSLISEYPWIKRYFQRTALSNLEKIYLDSNPGPCKGDMKFEMNEIDTRLKNSLEYIHANFARSITLDEIANINGVSRFHFSRLFKNHVGYSFKLYLNKSRLAAAKKLLLQRDMNISETCYAVGYNDVSYFSKIFKKFEGMSPSAYRETAICKASGCHG